MKKFITFLSVIVVVFALAACSQSNEPAPSGTTGSAQSSGASASSSGGDASPQPEAGQPVVIKWGNVFAADMPFNVGVAKTAELLKEKSGGQIEIQHFPASQLGDNNELMTMLTNGTSQMGNEGGGFLTQWAPSFLVSEAVYAFNSVDHMFSVMNGPIGQKMFDELLESRGVRVIDVWYYGTRHITSKKPIHTPDDLAGVKMRVPNGPVYIANGTALGANPTPIPLSEVYLSLSTGVIDAQENPLPTIDSFKFYEVQDYVNLTAHNYNFNVIMVNEAFWQGLSEEQQNLILEAVKEGGKVALETALAEEESLIEKLKGEGVTIIEPDIEAFRAKASAHMIAEFSDEWGEGFYESIQNYTE